MIGDYLYIDGGEVSQFVGGSFPSRDRPSNGVNSTLSINISKSWSASTVEIRAIPRPNFSAITSEAVWGDTTGTAFYTYGGSTAYNTGNEHIRKDGIWKFTADGTGGGRWSLEGPSNPDTFQSLLFASGITYVSANGIGFSIGGWADGNTDPLSIPGGEKGLGSQIQVPGMVSYDMKRREWKNHTTIGMLDSTQQSLRDGRALHVPTFGPNGLVFVLGGNTGGSMGPVLSFANVNFFDPSTDRWYWQTTTGVAPTGRVSYCAVGTKSTGGSYEM